MLNLGFPPATAAEVYSPQELTKDLAKYNSSKTYTKKPAEEPDEDEIKPSADYCRGDRCLAENVFLTSFSGKHRG